MSLTTAGQADLARGTELSGHPPSLPGLHRALRLIIAAGATAAGICLVLGMTALAVKIGYPGAAGPVPAADVGSARQVAARQVAAEQAAISASGQHPGRSPHWLPGTVIDTYRGPGPARSIRFLIASPGTWGLSWSLTCAAGRPGSLLVTGSRARAAGLAEVDAFGPTGHGITWYTRDPGRHTLSVSSDCGWTVQVVLPRPA